MERRKFLANTAVAGAAVMLPSLETLANTTNAKLKIVQVGAGHRGSGFWGRNLVDTFKDTLDYVGVYDLNPGRSEYAKNLYGGNCKQYLDFDKMLDDNKPDYVIVTTVDSTHHEYIVKALNKGYNVITEKPLTTDETKLKLILDAEKSSGKKVIVAFNYRHSAHNTRLKELLALQRIGKITSVDFHWYLNVYHGADYFRRWHSIMDKGGSLWVHKATHHFDLLNWWLNSEPVEVSAYGSLEHYGKNNSFRGTKCRGCEHKPNCKFYWDINKDKRLVDLYVKNEQHDGYMRDGCVWRNEIDIYDKMSAQIVYANGVTANYSLTTYSPYEGWKIAFNGMKGRIETWEDIPYLEKMATDQANRHATEMSNNNQAAKNDFRQIMVMDNFSKDYEMVNIPKVAGGHGGGDQVMQRRIFIDKNDNPNHVMADTRDGAMSILIGIAARKSIKEKRPVKISELTDIVSKADRF
jgi:predicted dehydrogenase